jgi:hypothetical protein
LALFAAWLTAFLVAALLELPASRYRSPMTWSPAWVLQLQATFGLVLVLTAALGLARSRWWARMLSVSLALATLFLGVMSAADEVVQFHLPELIQLRIAWAAALLACLHGPVFLTL